MAIYRAVSHCDRYHIIAAILGCVLSLWLKQLFHWAHNFFESGVWEGPASRDAPWALTAVALPGAEGPLQDDLFT